MVTPHQPADMDGASLSCHACLIYRSAGERWSRVADFVRTGLERGERVLCFTDLDREDAFLSRLRNAGLDAGGAVDSGQLLIRSAADACPTGGRFSPEESLRQLRTAIRRAGQEGWAGFRMAGGTGRVTAPAPESPRLVEYERRAGRVLDRYGCAGLCQYRVDDVDDTTLSELRRVHGRVLGERPGAGARTRRSSATDLGKRSDGGRADDPASGPADARHFQALLERYSGRLERSRRRLRRLSRRLLQVRDEERRRLSRELHDSLGRTLTALRVGVEGLLTGRRRGASGQEERGEELLSMVDRAIEQVQELSASVRPAVPGDKELFPSLREFVRSRAADAGLQVRFRAREPPAPVDDGVATACMRIVREAVTNAIRHADAARLTVTLRPSVDEGKHLVLEVADDGRGFRSGGSGGDRSGEEPGLTGMLERALSVGGDLHVDSEPGRGTRVSARLPLEGAT